MKQLKDVTAINQSFAAIAWPGLWQKVVTPFRKGIKTEDRRVNTWMEWLQNHPLMIFVVLNTKWQKPRAWDS